ncbi:MAG: hypothetical protein ABIN01_05850 [Ferruginibacter sp.]
MKNHLLLLLGGFICFTAFAVPQQQTFVGSTPAHGIVRNFLKISLTDSIDFIRWRLELKGKRFDLQCRYGLSKPGTQGFRDEKMVEFEGGFSKTGNQLDLRDNNKVLSVLQINDDLLHLLDQHNQMLVGNGGYSYALNSIDPGNTAGFNLQPVKTTLKYPLAYQGRTPCQELSKILGLNKTAACDKMKWYIIFYTDSLTGQPSHYLKGGSSFKKEAIEKGKWRIINKHDGRIIFEVTPDSKAYTLHLLKGDDNILFFTDPNGRVLIGNENFSYTLNRRMEPISAAHRY